MLGPMYGYEILLSMVILDEDAESGLLRASDIFIYN